MTLTVVRPWTVTPPMVESSVLEDEYPAYAPEETYAEDARVIHGHFVYQSLQADNIGHQPDENATWWVQLGPTNRMKAFDLSHSTQTRFPSLRGLRSPQARPSMLWRCWQSMACGSCEFV